MNKLVSGLLIALLFSIESLAYVHEIDEEADEKGLIKYEHVKNCGFYPQEAQRVFYFSPEQARQVSFENALVRLKSAGHTNQVKCISDVYEPGDLVYYFSKDLGSSYEEGFLIYREMRVIAVAFLEAVYTNNRNNLFQPMPPSWHG